MPLVKDISYGEEEIFLITNQNGPVTEEKQDNARKSHQDGSHLNRALTWNQRLNLGCMMLELAGDVE